MPLWSMDDWTYLQRQAVTDPKGREWVVALMDVLGQKGDPEMPTDLLEMQYESGRYFVLVYSPGGSAIQLERGFASLWEATDAFGGIADQVASGTLDPGQPLFRADLED